MMINGITRDNNKVLGGERNENVKFYILDRSTEEAVYTFQSVVKAEQRNGGIKKNIPLEEK